MAKPRTSLVVQTVKNLPAMQETWVLSPGWEDPPEKGMATHSREHGNPLLHGESPWTEEPGGLLSMESQELDKTKQLGTAQQRDILVAAS